MAPQADKEPVELLLDVHINNETQHEADVLLGFGRIPNKGLYAKATDLEAWRLKRPGTRAYNYRGTEYYPLDAIPGLRYRLDPASESLWISAPPEAFNGTLVDGLIGTTLKPQASPPGGFLNYDVFATRSAPQTTTNALLEAGFFNQWGVGTSSFVGQNLTDSTAGRQWIRLESTWIQDHPENLTTLRLGDSISAAGMTGLAVRFGGIQYGTNFSTQPYFITFPLPMIRGQTALPSTVQLYVNGVLKSSQQVPPGPFVIPAVPVVTGAGQATVVVQDILGRTQVISTPFLATTQLLKEGLDDYSFSVGKLRDNFGVYSNDYSSFLASGLYSRGITDNFTGELRAEISTGQQTVSAGAAFSNSTSTVFNTALAASHSSEGAGALGLFGFQSQWNAYNAGANMQFASPHFTEVGYIPGQPAPRRQVTLNGGMSLGPYGSATLAYIDMDSQISGHVRLLSASYNLTVDATGFLNLTAFHGLQGSSNYGAMLTFTVPFGERSSASVDVSRQNGVDQAFAQVQENLPAGTGSGYSLGTQIGPDPTSEAEYDYQNDVGTYRVSAFNAAHQTSYTGEISGGVAYLDGTAFAARRINGSFGVVELPGFPNVTVYDENQPVGVTDNNGLAVVPMLRPYEDNHISINPQDLPLSAEVNALNADAVPYYRSGVVVKFPVRAIRGATLTLRQSDGRPVPAGAIVRITGKSGIYPVGYDGEVYLTALELHNVIEASWDHQSCRVNVNMPQINDPLPDLGAFTCKLMSP